ncbi:MAG: ISAzo13 family transposase, partial [Planctomycetota bacterium]|nr:ISAzo13 family transposase [Planctomycetota bacterium]
GELGNDDLALAAISDWWQREGSRSHPQAKRILVVIDPVSGGGQGIPAWKGKLASLARSLDLGLDAQFFPPATYKWILPLRRLAGGVARDWRGRPRPDRETVVGLLGRTAP